MINNATLATIPSPCFVLDEARLERNLQVFERVQRSAPVKVLLALKGYALFHSFPMIRKSLSGASASSLWEARLAAEEFGGALHVYSPAYRDQDLPELFDRASHLTFNSLSQWERSRSLAGSTSIGLRINPLYSPVKTALYNPCQPGSRLGVLPEQLGDRLPDGISGFLSHNLCESDSFALEKTLHQIEQHYGHLLPQIQWLNLGGGHLMTHETYEVDHAIAVLSAFHDRYPHLQLYLEPGSAIVWQTGFLLSTVLDLIPVQDLTHVMLDVSFSAHMPDCLEMPYQPAIVGASVLEAGKVGYRLGGSSCLAGDFLGDYQFDQPLSIDDRIVFEDMMHYTMVKTTMFNGVAHPAIGCLKRDGSFELWRQFGYEDYRSRVG
ncbi:carboxynorspermidine decarboxylase [Leptolyngbya sp. FACHB-17]|uniref:carboxynorspermidine decarboxylase n=1 Tax=unclassified Leptolyngbya TaxID=2650499 RepID=UPI00168089F9|nr:carboxynorspermidine decarboxylase [Leptolyngbya sp. FACHB-17]MBD2082436.1 carboxynorspermidine decarboxylase [Leptolyngbya sp. FACHB-17]